MAHKRNEKRSPVPEISVVPPPADASGSAPWKRPTGLTRRGWAVWVGIVLLVNIPVLHHFLRGPMEATVSLPLVDDFSAPAPLAERYFSTGGDWRVRDGFLISPGVHNNPLWLKAKLPDNVRVAFDARAIVPEGDIRVELFGNGSDTLSGYRLVLTPTGSGSRAILYRSGENGTPWPDLLARAGTSGPIAAGLYRRDTAIRVESPVLSLRTNEAQHWTLERRSNTLRWVINDQVVLDFADPLPFVGRGHDRFGFSSGELDVIFDRLRIEPAAAGSLPPVAAAPAPSVEPPTAFADNFERTALGPDWSATEPGAVRLENGALTLEGAHNHPVWLNRRLPENAVIELDAWSDSPDGDLKVEVWGDGSSAHQGDLRAGYKASGYVLVMGGWKNTRSTIARREEHGAGATDRTDVKVEPKRHYHWRIVRQGQRLSWEVDGAPFLTLDDASPLRGPGQEHFAVSDWETRVHFDNIDIKPL